MSSPARLCRNNRYRLALKWHQPRIVIARRPQADAAISGRQLRFRRNHPVIQPDTARLPRRFAPRNDKFESLMPPNYRPNTCSCQWRSGNALQTPIGLCVFIVALYELQMPDTPFYADFTSRRREKYGALRENPHFSACFAAKTAYNGRKAYKKNNIAGKTDKRARNFSEQLKFLCNVV